MNNLPQLSCNSRPGSCWAHSSL